MNTLVATSTDFGWSLRPKERVSIHDDSSTASSICIRDTHTDTPKVEGKLIFGSVYLKTKIKPADVYFFHLINEGSSEKSEIYNEIVDKIRSLKNLDDGWDSYGAESPNKLACDCAEKMTKAIAEKRIRPNEVMASAEGGISFLFINGEKYADIECDNDGDIVAGFSNRSIKPIVWKIKETESGFTEAINRIKELLEI